MEQIDLALAGLRVWVGLVMVLHGINHGSNIDGTASWFASKGFRSAKVNARISSMGEIAIGLALIAGFLTSPAVTGLVAIMFVAFWSIHRFAGFFNFHRPDEGFEYVTTLAIAGTALAVAGPGEFSLDHVMGIADDLDGVVGLLFAVGGLVAGFGQTLVFWSRPEKKEEEEDNA